MKTVMRWDSDAKLYRIVRWGGNVFDEAKSKFPTGFYYGWKFTIALTPRIFGWRRELYGWILTLCGVRFHYERSFGGMYAG